MSSISLGDRLGSMLLDYFLLCAFAGFVGLLITLAESITVRFFNFDLEWLAFLFIFGIGLNKDYFRGKSVGKRALGLVVVKNKGGDVATKLQCFIRNLTFVLFPIEVLISLFSRQRRLGDFLAGTKIEISNRELISSFIDELKSEFKTKTNP